MASHCRVTEVLAVQQPWIDTHIHISDRAQDGTPRKHMLRDLLAVLDQSDADLRLVVSCDFPYMDAMITDPEALLTANRMVHEIVREAPGRLYGSCMINPRFLPESLSVMDLCFGEWGFVMLGEMLQYMMDYRMDGEAAEAVVRHATGYGVPVQVHLGTVWSRQSHPSGYGISQLGELLNLAERVPEGRYVLGHAIGCGPGSGYVPWANMYLDVLQTLCGGCPENFWVEIRDFHSPALRRALEELPPDRLLAGTDWTTREGPPFPPYGTMFGVAAADNPFPPRVESFLGYLRKAGASEETLSRIGYRNAAELLRLSA